MTDEDRLKQIEEKITELSRKLEEFGRDLGDRVEEKLSGVKHVGRSRTHGDSFLGFILIFGGLIWLGNRMNWYHFNIPFWPALLIVLGIYMLISSGRK